MKARKKVSQSIGGFFGRIYIWCKMSFTALRLSISTHKRLKIIGGGYSVTNQQFAEIKNYWKQYGVRPKKYWFKLYADRTKQPDQRYISDTIWYRIILPFYNNLMFLRAYTDKGMLERFLPQARQPHTVVKNIAGKYYNDHDQEITEQEAQDCCAQYNCLIFKPSVDSGAGQMIQFFDKEKMDESKIRDYFQEYFSNFVVQEIVNQHPDLARIHKDSLNTIRVISFNFHGEIHILSAQLRMGAGNARIDNYTAGGIACAIKEDGWLENEAITRQYTWTDCHPSGIRFDSIKVPAYADIVSAIKQYHPMLPYFNIIGWDFAVDDQGRPVLIEFNVTPAQNETGSKRPSFGDLTDEVLKDVFITRSLEGKMN